MGLEPSPLGTGHAVSLDQECDRGAGWIVLGRRGHEADTRHLHTVEFAIGGHVWDERDRLEANSAQSVAVHGFGEGLAVQPRGTDLLEGRRGAPGDG